MKRGLILITLMAWLAVPAPVESQLTNLSTRGLVQTGDGVQIGGFIIGGSDPKTVLIRARGPTLTDFGVLGELTDPFLQLFSGQTVMIAENDNWETTLPLCQNSGLNCGGAAEIIATSLDPCVGNMTGCARESAILVTLDPGPYTALVSGPGGGTGIGLVEVFEVGTTSASRLTNLSTRGVVGTGDDVMIGGFIIGGTEPKTVLIRARGPVLADFGVPGALADPFVQLFSGQTVIAQNDDWRVTDPLCGSPAVSCGGETEVIETGLDPCVGNMTGCAQESAILVTLPPGPYTAIVSGARGGSGVGLVEVFEVYVGTQLAASEVVAILQGAAASFDNANMTVAVVDRPGNILGVLRKPGADGSDDDLAVSLARTGAFFSNDQAPLSSRTVRFISGIHFPPGISFTPNAALYGIENTNRGCEFNVTFNAGKAVPRAKSVNGLPCNSTDRSGCGLGITTGKPDLFDSNSNAVNPGGLPIFRGSTVLGGIGVAIRDGGGNLLLNHAEFAAILATAGFPPTISSPGVIFIDGVRLPFVVQTTRPAGTVADPSSTPGALVLGPVNGTAAPDGYLVGPLAGSRLTAAQVDQIVQNAVTTANTTRAAIRLPLGSRTRMSISVADVDGSLLAIFRMQDSTIFSIDVAVAKARNVGYFSSLDPNVATDLPGLPAGTAITNRTISFGSQPFYPPGIDGTSPGPFFDVLRNDTENLCSQGNQAPNLNQSGIVFFPGSSPLYIGQELVGGLGVSGDGVEQDDFVTFGGSVGFRPPSEIRADQFSLRGVRLPFFKFPRNPTR